MRKLIYLFMAIAVLSTSMLFAQDVRRTLSTSASYQSGDFIPSGSDSDSDGAFDGSAFSVSLQYAQNFSTVPWLTFNFRAGASIAMDEFSTNAYTGYGYEKDSWSDYLGQRLNLNNTLLDDNGIRARVGVSVNGSGFGANGLSMSLNVDSRSQASFSASYNLPHGFSIGASVGVYILGRNDFNARDGFYTVDPDHENTFIVYNSSTLAASTNYIQTGYISPGFFDENGNYIQPTAYFDGAALSLSYRTTIAKLVRSTTTFQVSYGGIGNDMDEYLYWTQCPESNIDFRLRQQFSMSLSGVTFGLEICLDITDAFAKDWEMEYYGVVLNGVEGVDYERKNDYYVSIADGKDYTDYSYQKMTTLVKSWGIDYELHITGTIGYSFNLSKY